VSSTHAIASGRQSRCRSCLKSFSCWNHFVKVDVGLGKDIWLILWKFSFML
jgi:hypothetical protein